MARGAQPSWAPRPPPERGPQDEGEDEPAARAEEESSSDEEGAEAAAAAARPGRGLRGSVSLSSSSDDEDEDGPGGAGEAEEEGVLATFGADAEPGADAGADPTPRLAVVDLEWDRLRAVDVFAVLRSFLPPGGALRRVAVHPSDLGLSRLRDEEQHGPRAAFATEKQPGEGVAAEALRACVARGAGGGGGMRSSLARSLAR